MRFLDARQRPADRALAERAVDGCGQELCAGSEGRHDIVQHGLENRGHPGHDMDVSDPEARRHRYGIGDMLRAPRHARHALAGIGEFHAAARVVSLEHLVGFLIVFAGHAKRLGHGISGNVVMRGADAAGREDIGITRPQHIDGRYDCLFLVGNNTHFPKVDTDRRHNVGEVADIPVLGAAGKDLVANDDHGGSDDFGHWDSPLQTTACSIACPSNAEWLFENGSCADDDRSDGGSRAGQPLPRSQRPLEHDDFSWSRHRALTL